MWHWKTRYFPRGRCALLFSATSLPSVSKPLLVAHRYTLTLSLLYVQQRCPRSPLITNTCHWITARLNPRVCWALSGRDWALNGWPSNRYTNRACACVRVCVRQIEPQPSSLWEWTLHSRTMSEVRLSVAHTQAHSLLDTDNECKFPAASVLHECSLGSLGWRD